MAKGEKSLREIKAKQKLLEDEQHSFINSLPLNSHIKVRLNNKDIICKIIEIRPDPFYKKEEKPSESSYEYYIHYLGFDRRNDHWIKYKDIIETKVPNEEIKKFEISQKNIEVVFHNNENYGLDEKQVLEHEKATKVRTIEEIVLGKNRCSTWYFSPFPEEYHNIKTLFFCEFCLSFYTKKDELIRHIEKNCLLRFPPGNEIYRDDKISMFEVDGKSQHVYCENLSYLSKLFLDHKTLAYDVEPFLFYILTEYDKYGYHFVGYFSKEKNSEFNYNLSCILILPFHQRKGYGKFLIDFSYLLSKQEQKYGTPERPLSDLGFSTYFDYWTQKICETLRKWEGNSISINQIAEKTQIKPDDIEDVMLELHLLIKNKNENGVESYYIISDKKILEELEKRTGKRGYPLHPKKLIWTPYKEEYEF